jgi:RNA polymerase subunit RPABC4/transcription elongation factor Spt4
MLTIHKCHHITLHKNKMMVECPVCPLTEQSTND